MHILAIGLNFRTAPVEIREALTFAASDLPEALVRLKETKSVLECVIVGTCNRTEIYVVVDRNYMSGLFIRMFLEQWFNLPRTRFEPCLYVYEDEQAVRHLFRVACGLDSMIIGETQILGQVRDAFTLARQQKATGTIFNTLFKQAITLAKRVHAQTGIADNPVSVSYAAVELAKRILGSFDGKTVLLIGAGEMGELTARYIMEGRASRLLVVNRTLQTAKRLADAYGGVAHSFESLPDALTEADVVISSTSSKQPVLSRDQVEQAMDKRPDRPLFMVDIAVPRDIDPETAKLEGVYLYNIDDLQSIVDANLSERRREAGNIEQMIVEETGQFYGWLKTLGIGPVIKALQRKSNDIYDATISDLLRKLPDLDEREQKIVRKLAKSLVNQMLRDPILRIKELAAGEGGREKLKLFVELFALEPYLESPGDQTKESDSREMIGGGLR